MINAIIGNYALHIAASSLQPNKMAPKIDTTLAAGGSLPSGQLHKEPAVTETLVRQALAYDFKDITGQLARSQNALQLSLHQRLTSTAVLGPSR